MAERVGFEPTVRLAGVHTISSRAPSASSGISPEFNQMGVINYLRFGISTIIYISQILNQNPV